jgi:cyclopropane fatty-acyl-phospholipid synthase-like methyltransferase
MTAKQTHRTRRFYDSNTALFLRFGHSSQGSIHRAVWAESIKTRQAALHHVDDLLCQQINHCSQTEEPQVLDLGCGVGASLSYVAERLPIRGTGITISERQHALAEKRFWKHGQQRRLGCVLADFCHLPDGLQQADLVFAVESFVHAPDARDFFREAARHMKPGARLAICDDFLGAISGEKNLENEACLQRFRQGWLIGSLLSPKDADALAQEQGLQLVEHHDLSPFLELGRPRDWVIAIILKILGKLALLNNYGRMLWGGNALQSCLRNGYVKYCFLVWEKPYD